MGTGFAGRLNAVVAADTVAGDVDVIEIRRQPASGRMTVVAIGAARNMIGIFANGGNAVVTRSTGANDLHVINGKDGLEGAGAMAVLADVGRLYM